MQRIFYLLFLIPFVAFAQKSYFQQEVNYRMSVTLDDKNHTVSGVAEIEYVNRSPDRLDSIYFHLWGNAYKNRHTAYARQELHGGSTRFYFAKKSSLGSYADLAFEADGQKLDWGYDPANPDIALLRLPKSLAPGSRVQLRVPFTLKIPASFSRLGHVGESYQMTQWFPKPAVYDHKGWHPMPYLDMGEFYSEFGDYDVSITLPENYVVGATGTLQTQQEQAFLAEKVAATEALAKTGFPKEVSFPPSSEKLKTIRFTAENVHDFAWFADKRFHVLKNEATLVSGKKVNCWAFFTNEQASLWTKGADYVKRAVEHYSECVGEYPYPQATAVQSALSAGGGMEYPMITVIGKANNAKSLDRVITHEVGHNWFYGILASNERDHPWMDEGINTYYENRYIRRFYKDDEEFDIPKVFRGDTKMSFMEMAYLHMARSNHDQAPQTHSADFTTFNYGLDVYMKTGRAFRFLEYYLGTENFDRVMKSYYAQWKFRHPYPEDLRTILEKETGRDLGWLFEGLLYSTKEMDYAISTVKNNGSSTTVEVKNMGEFAPPFSVAGVKNGKVESVQWSEGFDGKKELTLDGSFDKIALDPDYLTFDSRRKNNQVKTSGLFAKMEPLQFKLFGGMDNPERSRVNWLPVLAWNNYDKTSLGLAFYSFPFPVKNFEYALAPMYGFGSKDFTGMGNLRYQIFPHSNIFQRVALDLDAKTFSFNRDWDYGFYDQYVKLAPRLSVDFAKAKPTSATHLTAYFRFVHITQQYGQGIDVNEKIFERKTRTYFVNDFQFKLENEFVLHPFWGALNVQQGKGFLRFLGHYHRKIKYPQKGKAFYLHGFAGWMTTTKPELRTNFFPNGTTGGYLNPYDFLYDESLLGRTDDGGFFARQVFHRDANLKTLARFTGTDEWLLGLGVRSGVPSPLPVEPYFDFAIYPDPFEDKINFTYSGGLALTLWRDVAEVYFPLIESKDIRESIFYKRNPGYFQRVSFLLNINQLNPWKMLNGPMIF